MMGQKNPSLRINICHHSASRVMLNHDPRDRFFYPIFTPMIDPYILTPAESTSLHHLGTNSQLQQKYPNTSKKETC